METLPKGLRKYLNHTLTCPALNRNVCTCKHGWNNHFQLSPPYPCAHCGCKIFMARECTCGLTKTLKKLGIKIRERRREFEEPRSSRAA